MVRSRTRCSIAAAASIGSSCSQILTTSQPAAATSVSVSRSRRATPRNFRRHQLVLVLGRCACSGQECQKQPSTNTAIRAPRNRTSARRRRLQPGTGRSTTNLKPRRCIALRNANSGPVPDRLVRRITNEVAGDDAGGMGPGSRCLYTAPASRDGPTAVPRTGATELPRACLLLQGRREPFRAQTPSAPPSPSTCPDQGSGNANQVTQGNRRLAGKCNSTPWTEHRCYVSHRLPAC